MFGTVDMTRPDRACNLLKGCAYRNRAFERTVRESGGGWRLRLRRHAAIANAPGAGHGGGEQFGKLAAKTLLPPAMIAANF
jgi:hypothetical protein